MTLCLKNELSSSDAASIAHEESGINYNSSINTIINIEHMIEGKKYPYSYGYEHTEFNVEKLIKDYTEKRDNIIKSFKLTKKNPNQKIIAYIKALE